MQNLLCNEKMTFLSIYTVISGPYWTAQKIHERGVVEVNSLVFRLYFKKGVERAEVDADVSIFQTKHELNKLEDVFTA